MTAQRFGYYTLADILRRRANLVQDTRKPEAPKMLLPEFDGMMCYCNRQSRISPGRWILLPEYDGMMC